jgi:hypothetical protein
MSISRRAFFKGTAAALAGAAASRSHATPGRKPNVVYLFSDEHRWQSLSFTEMPDVRTPHMASLAKQGVSFNYCISNYPVCSPHRAMLMLVLAVVSESMRQQHASSTNILPKAA